MQLDADVIWGRAALSALHEEWYRLSAQPPTCDMFLSPGFISAVTGVIDPHTKRGAIAVKDKGTLVGLVPIVSTSNRRGPRLSIRYDVHPGDARFLQEKPRRRFLPIRQISQGLRLESGDLRGGFLIDPRYERNAVLACAMQGLSCQHGWDMAVFSAPVGDMTAWADAAAAAGLGVQFRRTNRNFHVRDCVSWETLLKENSHNFRKNFKRAQRRALERGLENIILVGDQALGEGLRSIEQVAARSWKADDTAVRHGVFIPWGERQTALARAMAATGTIEPVIFMLADATCPRAAAIVYRYRDYLVGGSIFYDPEFSDVHPGRLLMKMMLEWAETQKLTRFDFNTTDKWITPFSNRSDEFLFVMLFSRNWFGRLLDLVSRRLSRKAMVE